MNVYKRLRWQGYGRTCVYGWLEFLSQPWQVGRRWGQQPGHALSYTSGLAWYPVSCPGGFPSRGFSAWRWHCWCVRSCWWWSALHCIGLPLSRLHPFLGVGPRPMLRTLGQSGQVSDRLAPWVSGALVEVATQEGSLAASLVFFYSLADEWGPRQGVWQCNSQVFGLVDFWQDFTANGV